MQSNSENNKIVGGEETAPNEFPWQALIVVEIVNNNEDKMCGGSLINDQWILTAAHCLLLTSGVYLGVHNYAATDEINRKMYVANNYVVHPDSNVNNFSNDIALIKLSTTVTFSQYIRPICLASSTEPDYINEPATVAGWGFTSDGNSSSASLSPVLRKVTVPVISNSVCSDTYPGMITEKIICTSGANRSGPCKSDSGGPLIFKESNGKWNQIGIVSFGSTLGCQKNFPSGYTRISSYSSWIQGVIAPTAPTKSPSTVTSTPVPTTSPYSSGPHTYAFLSVSLVIFSFTFSFVGGDKLLSS
ncbi:hypothetical protein DAPPUDRAFT_49162 [Daphnia pulex]|uniref:limulus clotting factor C n=1 Tax=Daphnia pulex TaxID=6669 RepID=E9GED4_DAPPU|nr:hypothetical protein DAPPUDRAFT_49162 [Daphnia pulex]|eukprot:EFX82246.1 hypothetical protein DAPPUDRAFT_49162 [Daphnia pulex]